jgi:tetratricopeptide (TPR) repeat protein
MLQLVPLPEPCHEWLNPKGRELFQNGWRAMFGQSAPEATWLSLSLDPGRTADRGIRWLTVTVIAMVVAERGARKGEWTTFLWIGTVGGGVVLLGGAIPPWLGVDSILFVYEPRDSMAAYSTFVNDNHASVFAGFSGLCAWTLALRTRTEGGWRRGGAALMGLVSTFVVLQAESASGKMIYFASLGLLSWLVPMRDPPRGESMVSTVLDRVSRSPWLRFVGGVVGGLAGMTILGTVFARDTLREWLKWGGLQFGGSEQLRVRWELIRGAVRAIGDYPLLGAGAGTVDRVLPPYLDWTRIHSATIPTIENEPVEWLLHFGIPIGVVINGLVASYLLFAFLRYYRRRRTRYAFAVVLAFFLGLAAQFHFPFFTLGLALPIVAALEACCFKTRPSDVSNSTGWSASIRRGVFLLDRTYCRWLWFGTAISGLLCGVGYVAWSVDVTDIPNDPAEASTRQFESLVSRIPSDGNLYARASRVARMEERVDTAIRRAKFAFEREPKSKMLLVKARNYRADRRFDDVVRTYRSLFSGRYPSISTRWIETYMMADLQSPERLASALEGAERAYWRRTADVLAEHRSHAYAARFALALVEAHPESFLAHRLLIEAYMAPGRYTLAEMWARQLLDKKLPDERGRRPAGYFLLSEALRRGGHASEAKTIAIEGLRAHPRHLRLNRQLVDLRTSSPQRASERERRLIERAVESLCEHTEYRGLQKRCWLGRGWLHEAERRLEDAVFSYERVAEVYEEPRSLMQFYVRTEQCLELTRFVREWRRERSEDETTFETFINRCHDRQE